MNVLSLFSGIGGLDLGLERAGMTVVGQVEIDPWCRRVLAKHWPEVPRHDDVRTCIGWWTSEPRPVVDLVCGGVPCQPVSVAGKQRAQADERWLWPVTIDAIGALRPRFALLENVTGLLARGMGDVLGQLAEIGYDAEWDCVSASAVGAPHQRDRVWIMAYPVGQAIRQQPVTQSRSSSTTVARHDGAHRDVADAAGARRTAGTSGASRQARDEARRPPSDGLGSQMADAGSERRGIRSRVFGRMGPAKCGWWVTEPDVGRVAYGIPRRVDRLRGLGNAVVPQVAEHIGRLIMAGGVDHGPR